jgi:transglutaminase-like putative cysteine protease
MSSSAHAAALRPGERPAAPARIRTGVRAERPLVRLATFGALALYGTLRWATLFSHGGEGRLLALLGLSLLLAGGRPLLARRSRPLAAVATALAVLAALWLAGVPFAWILHARIAVTGTAIGNGLGALPNVFVPYGGVNEWVRMVILLGAAALLLDAALLMAFAPRAMDDLRRAGAALPLVALAAVPTTMVHPRFPYLDGVVMFALLAAFAWGERIGPRRLPAACALAGIAALAAIIVAPSLDRHKPWLNYEAFAGTFAPRVVDTFNWTQSYGPISWPRRGHTVLEVHARTGEYWKAEDLDAFNGWAWSQGLIPGAGSTPSPSKSALRQWSQQIQVTYRDMRLSDVIGAGDSAQPTSIPQAVVAGFSPGTWTTGSDLGPGDSYAVSVYAPHPSAAQLAAAGLDYTGVPDGYRTIMLAPVPLPGAGPSAAGTEVGFPPFHSGLPARSLTGLRSPAALIEESPYARAYALAERLARRAATPYAFVQAVQRLLAHGYHYSENPPPSAYPLESFLFASKLGYCQQFAGAMALLLRMGGVPARVAVGFTSGRFDATTQRWRVSDLDAHAWVEAWFPRYGWVRFDPTPAADPALGGRPPSTSLTTTSGPSPTPRPVRKPEVGSAAAAGARGTRRHASGSGGVGPLPVAVVGLGAIALLLALIAGTRPLSSEEALLAELERAMARSGRPLGREVTLAALEHRMAGSPEAAAYIRALRLRRFGGHGEAVKRRQRRALRRQLGLGLGPTGRLRAWWALPPRRAARARARHREGA